MRVKWVLEVWLVKSSPIFHVAQIKSFDPLDHNKSTPSSDFLFYRIKTLKNNVFGIIQKGVDELA